MPGSVVLGYSSWFPLIYGWLAAVNIASIRRGMAISKSVVSVINDRANQWYSRFFSKSHLEIECDPKVWSQVKTLLRPRLPDPPVTEGAENRHQTLDARELQYAERRRTLRPE
jgi:hypothetical protein